MTMIQCHGACGAKKLPFCFYLSELKKTYPTCRMCRKQAAKKYAIMPSPVKGREIWRKTMSAVMAPRPLYTGRVK